MWDCGKGLTKYSTWTKRPGSMTKQSEGAKMELQAGKERQQLIQEVQDNHAFPWHP